MAKRIVALVFVVIMLLLAAGCAGDHGGQSVPGPTEASATGSASADPEPDETAPAPSSEPADDKFYVVDLRPDTQINNVGAMLETDDSLYYLCSDGYGGNYQIWFTDKEYKDWMPLCAKPDCLHKGSGCSAALEGNVQNTFWLYGRHIYYIIRIDNASGIYMGIQLWRMKLDGSDHELVLEPELEHSEEFLSIPGPNQFIGWQFTRNYAIVRYSVSGTDADGNIAKTVVDSYIIDLSRPEDGAVSLEFTDENGEAVPLTSVAFSKGEKLYALAQEHTYIPETDSVEYGPAEISVYDLSTMKVIKLCELEIDVSNYLRSEYEGILYFVGCWNTDGCDIYSVDLETGEVQKPFVEGSEPVFWSRPYKQYIFGFVSGASDYSAEYECGTYIYGMDGSLLQQIPFGEGVPALNVFMNVGDYAFGMILSGDPAFDPSDDAAQKHPPVWYLDMRDFGTDKLRWQKWEP